MYSGENISPKELKEALDGNPDIFLLDVREAAEVAICDIEGAHHIPLGLLPLRLSEVPTDRNVVIYCKIGGRSAQAVAFLKGKGYTRVYNMSGGILRWIHDVDGSLTAY